ncbi:hypothetical protein BH18ACT15_BH18ACT15_04130 [soil metagenome]
MPMPGCARVELTERLEWRGAEGADVRGCRFYLEAESVWDLGPTFRSPG